MNICWNILPLPFKKLLTIRVWVLEVYGNLGSFYDETEGLFDRSFHFCYTKEARVLILGLRITFGFIYDDKSEFVGLKWTMGTGLVVQNNAPLTSSSELTPSPELIVTWLDPCLKKWYLLLLWRDGKAERVKTGAKLKNCSFLGWTGRLKGTKLEQNWKIVLFRVSW